MQRYDPGILSRIRDAWRCRARCCVASLVALGAPVAAQADAVGAGTAPRPLRLGVFFWHDSPNDEAAFEGIRTALAEIGRPHEFAVERAAEDRAAAERSLDGFRARRVDAVFAMGTQAALLAAERIRDLPIVFTAVTHPVESGVVASWQGSGRNLAGNSNWIAPQTVVRVFRLTVPKLRRLGMLRSRDGVVSIAELRSLRAYVDSAPVARLEILEAVVDDPAGLPQAVDDLVARGAEALWIPIDRLVYENTPAVFAAARRHGVPIVSSSLRGARSGATSGVVADYVLLGKRAVALALEIIDRGADPGAMPIGSMSGYRVVVNIEAARQCGYEVPLSLLVLADVLLESIDNDDASIPRSR